MARGHAAMKRIDYFWPRAALQITGIVFFVQLLTEVIGNRKPGFEWVLPVCTAAFVMAFLWVIYALVVNTLQAREHVDE
jgi:hypothetical protein